MSFMIFYFVATFWGFCHYRATIFCERIATQKFTVESCLDLTSDRTPILVTMYTHILCIPKKPSLYNKYTDWDAFREMLDARINLAIPLKTDVDIEEADVTLTNAVQQVAWHTTPPLQEQHIHDGCPALLKQKLTEKRKARKGWQITRAPQIQQAG